MIVCLLLSALAIASASLQSYLWQAKDFSSPNIEDFPETEILKEKPSTAIGFSGELLIVYLRDCSCLRPAQAEVLGHILVH